MTFFATASMRRMASFVCGGVAVGAVFSQCAVPVDFAWSASLVRSAGNGQGGAEPFSQHTDGPMTVHCRPLDTPEYLIPYYLRSTQARFNHYASIRKKSGERFMTAADFLCAILGKKDTTLPNGEAAASDLQKLFSALDTNGDGKLSFQEFSFFLTILATTREDIVTAFTMFSQSPLPTAKSLPDPLKATLSYPEFKKFVISQGDDAAAPDNRNGIVKKLFGATAVKRCSASEFLEVVDALKMEVWKAEFRQYDKRGTGAIAPEKFGQLIADHLIGSHLPFYLVDNLRKLKLQGSAATSTSSPSNPAASSSASASASSPAAQPTTIAFSHWVSFARIMENAEAIGEAVRLYTSAGRRLDKPAFSRAVLAAGLPPISKPELDLLFTLFDRDGDGSIEFDEFASIAGNRVGLHLRSSIENKERVNLFSQLAKCAGEATS